MDPSISIENQKLALQLKYLISLSSKDCEQQMIQALNKLHPFTQYPLTKLPPVQFYEYQPNQIICTNLRKQIQSYFYIIILGKCSIKKEIYSIDQQKLIDQDIKQKLFFNFDEGETILSASNNVTLLKIHNIWLKMAKNNQKQKRRKYIEQKLIKIPFFNQLPFEQFHKICDIANIQTIGPSQILIQQNLVPYKMYVVIQGEMAYRKKVDFIAQDDVWIEINNQLQKKNTFCEELYDYLVREPTDKSKKFYVNFEIKLLGESSIFCGNETLNQMMLPYTICSTLKSKIISIKYPDLYVMNQDKLSEIRSWLPFQVDKKHLRKQYYFSIQWQRYKQYLYKQQQWTIKQNQKFQDFLRKEVNLNEKKYYFFPEKIGDQNISNSPAFQLNRVKKMTFSK